mmetsp:Transcript_123692/g.385152  ORF Transcript_123692/g.385152 Transcript_123692/m.385152 type:complete len:232 (-) Transcript_123692:306-1001(-)
MLALAQRQLHVAGGVRLARRHGRLTPRRCGEVPGVGRQRRTVHPRGRDRAAAAEREPHAPGGRERGHGLQGRAGHDHLHHEAGDLRRRPGPDRHEDRVEEHPVRRHPRVRRAVRRCLRPGRRGEAVHEDLLDQRRAGERLPARPPEGQVRHCRHAELPGSSSHRRSGRVLHASPAAPDRPGRGPGGCREGLGVDRERRARGASRAGRREAALGSADPPERRDGGEGLQGWA